MKPIFKYLKKLTLYPTKMVQADADDVFSAGWSKRALYDAIIIVSLVSSSCKSAKEDKSNSLLFHAH